MRLIDLSLDQLSTNSLLYRLRYGSDSVFFFFLKLFQEYIGREGKSNTKIKKDIEQKMIEKVNSTPKKKGTQLREKKMKSGTPERRERENMGFTLFR